MVGNPTRTPRMMLFSERRGMRECWGQFFVNGRDQRISCRTGVKVANLV